MRRIIFYICLLCIFQASGSEIFKNKSLEQKAKRIFKWEITAQPLSGILLEHWNSEKNKEMVALYINFFDSVMQELFSEKGINPRISYSLRSIAPIYIRWAKEAKKEETLSNVVALFIGYKTADAENILKKLLSETPGDKNLALVAGIAFNQRRNSTFLQEKWIELRKTKSKQLVTVGLFLGDYIWADKTFRQSIYKLVEENIEMIHDITLQQKEALLSSYILDNLNFKSDTSESLKNVEKTFLYQTLAPYMKGKSLKIAQSKTALLINIKKEKTKNENFSVEIERTE